MRNFFLTKLHVNFFATCNPFQNVVTENVITLLTQSKAAERIPVYTYDTEKQTFVLINYLDVSYCRQNLYNEIILGISPSVVAILNQMKYGTKPLSYYTVSKRGAEVSKKNIRKQQSTGSKSLIGMDVNKYHINWENTYLEHSNEEYQRLKDFFSQPMIYLRRVDNCLEAAYSDKEYAFNKNLYGIAIKNDSEYSLLYLLGIINSTAANYYYKQRFSLKKGDAFPEIQTYLYEQIPIPQASKKNQSLIESLVSDLLAGTDNSQKCYESLDNIIYQLYGLSADEIDQIKNARE